MLSGTAGSDSLTRDTRDGAGRGPEIGSSLSSSTQGIRSFLSPLFLGSPSVLTFNLSQKFSDDVCVYKGK